jgi:hypothetical protein
MVAVLSDPSFSMTRCASLVSFTNFTGCPPADAGFGVNENDPLWPMMRMMTELSVGAGVGEGVGVVELLLLPPPPQLAQVRATPSASTPRSEDRMDFVPPLMPVRRS